MSSFKYIIIPIIAVIISQAIKMLIDLFKYKRINFLKFFEGMGGMPSSHCSLVSSISTLLFLNVGCMSPMFGLCFIFSLVVIYDSMGVRYESGMQARVLNRIANTSLKESLGHKPIEAIVGMIIGILVALLFNKVI